MGVEANTGVQARATGRWRTAAVALVALAAAGACTPAPPGPPTPSPPELVSFALRSSRAQAPVTAVATWSVRDPDGDVLTCRLDLDDDGAVDRVIRPCRSIDTALVPLRDPGTHRVTLEVDDGHHDAVVGTRSIDVAPGPGEDYRITLRLDPSMRAEFRDAFTAAAARWSELIVAGAPDQRLVLPEGFLGFPGFDGVVDDLLIDARDVAIDGPGGVLGRAGGLAIRNDAWQPYWGIMEFDTADLDQLAAVGRLGDVILHEMGHVLGLGANWLLTGSLANILTDPVYTGRAAVAAHQELGGRRFVPVENQGRWGTVLGHWRESTFGDELMTGYLGRGEQPISRLTVGALADLGYGVELDAADAYEIPSAPAVRDVHDHDGDARHTQLLAPLIVGRRG